MFVYAKDSASTRKSAQTNPHLSGMYKLSRIQLFMILYEPRMPWTV